MSEPRPQQGSKRRTGTPQSKGASSAPQTKTWLIGGTVVVLIIVAFVVAVLSTGGTDSAEGVVEVADVTIIGTSLPTYPAAGAADDAVGMAMPELEGVSFDGTPVSIVNDGRSKVLLFLAHW